MSYPWIIVIKKMCSIHISVFCMNDKCLQYPNAFSPPLVPLFHAKTGRRVFYLPGGAGSGSLSELDPELLSDSEPLS